MLTVIAWGAFNIQSNFFLKAVHGANSTRKQLAITFDDGPHPYYTTQVLALLQQYDVRATFFCIGNNVEQHPDLVKQIHLHGHLIGNHSFTHAATIDFHSKERWLSELRMADAAISRVIGSKPRFFRPPYGVTTPHLAQAIKTSGHLVIGWRIRPYDTVDQKPIRVTEKILKKVKAGDIILLHDTHERILPVLEQLLPKLKEQHFELVTVEELIKQHAYTEI